MLTFDQIAELLQHQLGAEMQQAYQNERELWVRVSPNVWTKAAEAVKTELGFDYLSFVSAIDWLPNPNLDGEHIFDSDKEAVGLQEVIVDPEIRMAGGDTRFQVMARLYNTADHMGFTLLADVAGDSPHVASLVPVYRGANWHERETWEMFGITFDGHPGLRHLYLPSEFEGFPLRKDFALMARVVKPWPGLVDMEEMPPPPETPADAIAEAGE